MSDVPIELHDYVIDRRIYASVLLRELRRRYRKLFLGFGALVALVIAQIAWTAANLVGFLIASAPVLLFSAAWFWFALQWMPRRIARDPMNRFQFDTYHVAVSGDRLEVRRSSGAHSELPLGQIVQISRHADHVLLYESSWVAHIIPRSAFKSSDDEAEFDLRLAEATKAA